MRRGLLFLLVLPAWAHDLYVMPQKFRAAWDEQILISVHTGDSFPASESAPDRDASWTAKYEAAGARRPSRITGCWGRPLTLWIGWKETGTA